MSPPQKFLINSLDRRCYFRKTNKHINRFFSNLCLHFIILINDLYMQNEWTFIFQNFVVCRDNIQLTNLIFLFHHGTIIWTGITCKKIFCNMRDSACRWFIVEKAKIFWSYIFEFLLVWENVKSWLVYANKLFWIAQQYFSTDIIKWS